jgi:hypothetical protein
MEYDTTVASNIFKEISDDLGTIFTDPVFKARCLLFERSVNSKRSISQSQTFKWNILLMR